MKRFEHGGNLWHHKDPGSWLDFSANINPYGPPSFVINALEECLGLINIYPEPSSLRSRAELAEYLGITVDLVLPTSGGIQAMELVMRVLLPSHTLIIQPGFVEYERLAMIYSNSYQHLLAFDQAEGFSLDWEQLEKGLAKAEVVFLCNPSNPTGHALNTSDLQRLLNLCAVNQALLILDEAFIHYCPDKTMIRQIGQYQNLIIVGSLTKIYAVPGVRLGYLSAASPLIKRFEKYLLPWNLNLFAQAVALTLNSSEARIFEKDSVKQNRLQRQFLGEGLKPLNVVVYPSEANFLLLNIANTGLSGFELNNRLEEHRIKVRDCSNFIGLGQDYIRIAVKNQQQNERLIRVMSEVLRCGT